MVDLEVWEMALLAGASYVAVMALVRMMQRRRDAILEDLAEQLEVHKERLRTQEQRERRKQLQEEFRDQQRDAA